TCKRPNRSAENGMSLMAVLVALTVIGMLVAVCTAWLTNLTKAQTYYSNKADRIDMALSLTSAMDCGKSFAARPSACDSTDSPWVQLLRSDGSVLVSVPQSSNYTMVGVYALRAKCVSCTISTCVNSTQIVIESQRNHTGPWVDLFPKAPVGCI